jgi:hypothetical protein
MEYEILIREDGMGRVSEVPRGREQHGFESGAELCQVRVDDTVRMEQSMEMNRGEWLVGLGGQGGLLDGVLGLPFAPGHEQLLRVLVGSEVFRPGFVEPSLLGAFASLFAIQCSGAST